MPAVHLFAEAMYIRTTVNVDIVVVELNTFTLLVSSR